MQDTRKTPLRHSRLKVKTQQRLPKKEHLLWNNTVLPSKTLMPSMQTLNSLERDRELMEKILPSTKSKKNNSLKRPKKLLMKELVLTYRRSRLNSTRSRQTMTDSRENTINLLPMMMPVLSTRQVSPDLPSLTSYTLKKEKSMRRRELVLPQLQTKLPTRLTTEL